MTNTFFHVLDSFHIIMDSVFDMIATKSFPKPIVQNKPSYDPGTCALRHKGDDNDLCYYAAEKDVHMVTEP